MRLAGLAATVVALVLALPAQSANRLQPVPILMYHVVSNAPANAPYPELYVPRPHLAAQVAWLAAHGYHAITLQRVFDAWRGAAKLPAKPIVVSFDDGYLSQVKNALPLLSARRWPGVLNLEWRNTQVVWGIRPPGIRKLINAGWEIDAHTLTHPDLTKVSAAQLRDEVAGSRGRSGSASTCRSTSSATRPGGTTTRSSPRCRQPATSARRPRTTASRDRATCTRSLAYGSTAPTACPRSPRSSRR